MMQHKSGRWSFPVSRDEVGLGNGKHVTRRLNAISAKLPKAVGKMTLAATVDDNAADIVVKSVVSYYRTPPDWESLQIAAPITSLEDTIIHSYSHGERRPIQAREESLRPATRCMEHCQRGSRAVREARGEHGSGLLWLQSSQVLPRCREGSIGQSRMQSVLANCWTTATEESHRRGLLSVLWQTA